MIKEIVLSSFRSFYDTLYCFLPSQTTDSIGLHNAALFLQGNTGYSIYHDCDTTAMVSVMNIAYETRYQICIIMACHDAIPNRGRTRQSWAYVSGRQSGYSGSALVPSYLSTHNLEKPLLGRQVGQEARQITGDYGLSRRKHLASELYLAPRSSLSRVGSNSAAVRTPVVSRAFIRPRPLVSWIYWVNRFFTCHLTMLSQFRLGLPSSGSIFGTVARQVIPWHMS